MKKLIFLFSIFAIILSCSSDETSTPVTPPAPIVKYTITLSAGEGGTVSTSGGEYEAGETVSVTATPQGEYLLKIGLMALQMPLEQSQYHLTLQ